MVDGFVERVDGFLEAVEVVVRVGQVHVGVEVGGVDGEHVLIHLDGLLKAVHAPVEVAERRPHLGVLGVVFDGHVVVFDGFVGHS